MNPLILASASPRRIEMFQARGLTPQIMPSKTAETLPFFMKPETTVMYLALKKAIDVERQLDQETLNASPIIVAADTVVYERKIIGKPKGEDEALQILTGLSGKSHFVLTGVAILKGGLPIRRAFYEKTAVFFKPIPADELAAYVKTEEPYDKAGGYAIQGTFQQYVDHIEGDVDNVIGFPFQLFQKHLAQIAPAAHTK